MNKKKEKLLKHYETWLWYSRGDRPCKKAIRKEMILTGIIVVPMYLLLLSALAFLFKFIMSCEYMNALQAFIGFFFLPCIPGCICALIYPIYEEHIFIIGYATCILIGILKRFMSLDYSVLLSIIIAIAICQKLEAEFRRSKEIEIEILINKLESDNK